MKKIAIVGGGVEGLSSYKYFTQQPDVEITILDQNPLEASKFPRAKLVTGANYLNNLDQYHLVVRSPGTRPDKLSVSPDKVTSNTKEFFKVCPAPIIGVTGTKGKGTTSTLIAKFLEADGKMVHLLGNIGAPALDELAKIKPTDWVVYELSSFQLWDLDISPHIAVHLMFEPDHLEVHKDLAEYARAKANIFLHQKQDDVAIYYELSQEAKAAANKSAASTKIAYNRDSKGADVVRVKSGKVMFGEDEVVDKSAIKLVGEHMLDNVCAAVAATYQLIVDKSVYGTVLKDFTGLPHRLQPVATKHGVLYIDDSISTIPSTAIAAINAFTEPKIIILGGSDKGSNYNELGEMIAKSNVELVVLLGQMADKIASSLDKAGYTNYKKAISLDKAVTIAAAEANPGMVVLLSPACASFDMFTGYAERGDTFAKEVNKL